MIGNYTKEANNRCYNAVDEDIYKIWDTIESLSEEDTAECWKEKITAVADEYSFSSRFALMRIIYSRAMDVSLGEAYTEDPFEIETADGTFTFAKLTMEHAKELPETELKQYESILMEMASMQEGAMEIFDRYLITRALRDAEESESIALSQAPEGTNKKSLAKIKKESRTLLGREEALKLGHILMFRFEEMSWFLLRVFDFEDGFRYNVSGDLIEAYVFLTGAGAETAERLKSEYKALAKDVQKAAEGRAADWTQSVSDSLPELTAKWAIYPDTMEQEFMSWLMKQCPYLDLPSNTATNIYRQLSCYVYEISEGIIAAPTVEEYRGEIDNICAGESAYAEKAADYLCDAAGSDRISPKKCKSLSGDILEKNKNLYTSAPDRAKAWRTITSDEMGLPRLIMAGRPDAERSRVQDLLEGTAQIEKGDMLHMLWYGFNLCWEEKPISNDMEDLQWNLADFTEASEQILDAALLPPFYPPHIMEQSMMLSIVVSIEDDGIPASNYATLCESLIKPRNRVSGK